MHPILIGCGEAGVEWDAKDKDKIYEYNHVATKLTIKRAMVGEPTVKEWAAAKPTIKSKWGLKGSE